MNEPEAPTHGPAMTACESCGRHPRWETLVDGDEERWFAACRCGRMQAFLPDAPELQPEDPLGAFLAGPGRALAPASPPWIRLFLRSLEEPNPTRWTYCPGPCPGCQAAAKFGFRACPRPFVLAMCTLCLSCGLATAAYLRPSRGMQESPGDGQRLGATVPGGPAPAGLRLPAVRGARRGGGRKPGSVGAGAVDRPRRRLAPAPGEVLVVLRRRPAATPAPADGVEGAHDGAALEGHAGAQAGPVDEWPARRV